MDGNRLTLIPLVIALAAFNTLVAGETQRGKSTLVLNEDIIPTIESNSCAVVILDPHSSLAHKAAQYAVTMGHGHRLIVDDLSNTEFVASPGVLRRSTAKSALRRRYENRRMAKNFLSTLAMGRKEDVFSQPNNRKYTLLAILAWLGNERDLELAALPWALRTGTPLWDEIRGGVTDPELAYELDLLRTMSPTRLMEYAGGAMRLLAETFDEEPFKYRTQPTFDLGSFLAEKGILCVKGGDADDHTVSTLMRLLNILIIQHVKSHYGETGRMLSVKIYIDEAANYSLIGLPESRALGQTTKMGLTWTIVVQAPNFADPVVNEYVMANTPRKIWLRCASPTSKTAVDDLKAMLDPHKEHHREVTRRQRHAGVTIGQRQGRTVTKAADGTERIAVTSGDSIIPIYEDFEDVRTIYTQLHDQELLNEAMIQRLPRGQCVINTGDRVLQHAFSPWEDPGTFDGYSDALLEDHVEWLKSRGILRPPVETQPCTSRPTPRNGKARSRKGANGMS